jgi:hypothetical protein
MKEHLRQLLAGFLSENIPERERATNLQAFTDSEVIALFEQSTVERIDQALRKFRHISELFDCFCENVTETERKETEALRSTPYIGPEQYKQLLLNALRFERNGRIKEVNETIAQFHRGKVNFEDCLKIVRRTTDLTDRKAELAEAAKEYETRRVADSVRADGIDLLVQQLRDAGLRLCDGKVMVVGGYEDAFCATTVQTIALKAVWEGKNVLYFCADETSGETTQRFLVSHARNNCMERRVGIPTDITSSSLKQHGAEKTIDFLNNVVRADLFAKDSYGRLRILGKEKMQGRSLFQLLQDELNGTARLWEPNFIDLVVIESFNSLAQLADRYGDPSRLVAKLAETLKLAAEKEHFPVLMTYAFSANEFKEMQQEIAAWKFRKAEVEAASIEIVDEAVERSEEDPSAVARFIKDSLWKKQDLPPNPRGRYLRSAFDDKLRQNADILISQWASEELNDLKDPLNKEDKERGITLGNHKRMLMQLLHPSLVGSEPFGVNVDIEHYLLWFHEPPHGAGVALPWEERDLPVPDETTGKGVQDLFAGRVAKKPEKRND